MTLKEEDHKSFYKIQKGGHCLLARKKLKEMIGELIKSLGVGRYLDWASISAVGASAGIVVFWDSRVF